jgi:hypothetical protein
MELERITDPELTPEEALTQKVNDLFPRKSKWQRTQVGELREKFIALSEGRSVHVSQSRDAKTGKVTSRLQLGILKEGSFPNNRWVEWTPEGTELVDSPNPLPLTTEQIDELLDEVLQQTSQSS